MVGCVYYVLARILELRNNTWVGQFEESMHGLYDRRASPVWETYLAIIYRGWIGLAPNSYRMPPQNWPEQLWSVIVMFLAMALSAYLLGTVLPYIGLSILRVCSCALSCSPLLSSSLLFSFLLFSSHLISSNLSSWQTAGNSQKGPGVRGLHQKAGRPVEVCFDARTARGAGQQDDAVLRVSV